MGQQPEWIQHIVNHFQKTEVKVNILSPDVVELNSLTIRFISADTGDTEITDTDLIIHEDIFRQRTSQVFARLHSLLGLNKYKVNGRSTRIELISKNVARSFTDENHLMGYCNGKIHLGLFLKDKLVAVGVFSGIRLMKYENPPYASSELERFCSLADYSVVGGLDKLVKYYLKNYPADDLITTTDADWSNGNVYTKIGFEQVSKSKSVRFSVNKNTFERKVITDSDQLNPDEYEVKNRGNIKFRIVNRFRESALNLNLTGDSEKQ
ncbi:MAG: hypothetical protein IPM77_01070 [Crocinitomicaceae bacterium]|nr:hypothetical protein [Crocinitomicaceae bacterium]